MIKTIHLRNLRTLVNLQKQGNLLDLEERLVHPHSPLRSALLTKLIPTIPKTATYILDFADENKRHQGLIQTRNRPGRPEQDVIFLSPMLAYGNGTHAAWQRLLTHVCVKAGEAGHQRIYARVEQGGDEAQIFKNVGFSAYAEEKIYYLTPDRFPNAVSDTLGLRKQTEADSWSLQRLYAAVTPKAVQIAEGLAQGQWQLDKSWISDQGHRYGYVWEREGEILALLHIHSGSAGHWFKILIHPDVVQHVNALIQGGLSMLHSRQNRLRKPIYGNLRTYQAELGSALLDNGFRSMTTQVVMVKHTTVRSKDFLTRLVAAFEGSVEATRATQTPFMNSDTVPAPPPTNKITANGGY